MDGANPVPVPIPLRERLRMAASHEAPPWIQFLKYGIAGGFALLTDLIVFTLANLYLFPIGEGEALGFRDLLHSLGSDPRVINYLRCNLLAFVFSNVVAYFLNVKWVFRGGRHRRHLEITLFLLASFAAFVLGSLIGAFLLGALGWNEYFAKAGNVVGAVLINFLCRKFIVFKG